METAYLNRFEWNGIKLNSMNEWLEWNQFGHFAF